MSIDHTKIKNISIKFNNGVWNADTHSIILTRDTSSKLGFTIKMTNNINPDLTLANDLLKKFRINQ
jgi:hypothetical protein